MKNRVRPRPSISLLRFAAMLALLSLVLTSCKWPWEGPSAPGSLSPETHLTSGGGAVEVEGAIVTAHRDTAPEGTRLAARFTDTELPSALGSAFEAASRPLDITLGDGLQPKQPLTVSIPVDVANLDTFDNNAPALAVLIVTDGHDQSDIVEGKWDPATKTVTAQIPHLSKAQVVHFNVSTWINDAKATMLQSLGLEFPQPDCADKSVTVARQTYSAISDARAWICVGSEGNALTVTAYSNSPIPYMVKPDPKSAGDTKIDFSRPAALTLALAKQLGFTGSEGEGIMFPGGSTKFTFSKPPNGATLSFSMLPNVLLLSVLTQTLDGVLDRFGQKLSLDKLSTVECGKDILETALKQDITAETASSYVKSFFSCVGEFAELTPVGQVLLLLVSAAPAAFAATFIGLYETVTGKANFQIVVDKTTELSTFSDAEMGISFKYPATWSVTKPSDPRIKTGAEIYDEEGNKLASANFNTQFDFQPCAALKPYQLIESINTNIPGMDTSKAPTTIKTETVDVGPERTYYSDRKPIRLGIGLYSGPGQPPGTTQVCNPDAFIQSNGKFGFFSAALGFNSIQEAVAFTKTTKSFQIKAMLASLRFL